MKTFRGLAVVAAVAVYLQVVLGSVVRITGSGLGCPDWPLCHGAIVPAFEYHTMIEYAHRLVGTSAGLLMVATAGYAFVLYRRGTGSVPRGLVVASVGALLLIVAQGIVGGITVLMKNSPFTVAIHLGNAELVLGAAILVALWAARAARGRIAIPTRRLGTPVILVGLAGAYLVVVTGAIVVGTGASGACSSWPLCGGTGRLADTHMLHRAVVLLGSLAILGAVHSARRRWRGQRLGVAAYVVGALLVAEVAVGAAQVLNGLPAALRSIHVALASGVWGGMVLLAGGTWLERDRRWQQLRGGSPSAAGATVNL